MENFTNIDRTKPGVLLDLLPEMPYLTDGPGQRMFRQAREERGDEFADAYTLIAADLAIHFMHITRGLERVDNKNLVRDGKKIEKGSEQTTLSANVRGRGEDSGRIHSRVMASRDIDPARAH